MKITPSRCKYRGISQNVIKIKRVFIIRAISTTFPKSPNLPKITILSKNAKIGQNRPKFTIFQNRLIFNQLPIYPHFPIFLIMLHFAIYPYFPYLSYLHFSVIFSVFRLHRKNTYSPVFSVFTIFYISAFSLYMNFVHIFHIPSFQYKEIPNILLFFSNLQFFQ